MTFRNYVQGYGLVQGMIQQIMPEQQLVLVSYDQIGKKEQIQLSQAAKLLKKSGNLKENKEIDSTKSEELLESQNQLLEEVPLAFQPNQNFKPAQKIEDQEYLEQYYNKIPVTNQQANQASQNYQSLSPNPQKSTQDQQESGLPDLNEIMGFGNSSSIKQAQKVDQDLEDFIKERSKSPYRNLKNASTPEPKNPQKEAQSNSKNETKTRGKSQNNTNQMQRQDQSENQQIKAQQSNNETSKANNQETDVLQQIKKQMEAQESKKSKKKNKNSKQNEIVNQLQKSAEIMNKNIQQLSKKNEVTVQEKPKKQKKNKKKEEKQEEEEEERSKTTNAPQKNWVQDLEKMYLEDQKSKQGVSFEQMLQRTKMKQMYEELAQQAAQDTMQSEATDKQAINIKQEQAQQPENTQVQKYLDMQLKPNTQDLGQFLKNQTYVDYELERELIISDRNEFFTFLEHDTSNSKAMRFEPQNSLKLNEAYQIRLQKQEEEKKKLAKNQEKLNYYQKNGIDIIKSESENEEEQISGSDTEQNIYACSRKQVSVYNDKRKKIGPSSNFVDINDLENYNEMQLNQNAYDKSVNNLQRRQQQLEEMLRSLK